MVGSMSSSSFAGRRWSSFGRFCRVGLHLFKPMMIFRFTFHFIHGYLTRAEMYDLHYVNCWEFGL
jgi:hypothetical protein